MFEAGKVRRARIYNLGDLQAYCFKEHAHLSESMMHIDWLEAKRVYKRYHTLCQQERDALASQDVTVVARIYTIFMELEDQKFERREQLLIREMIFQFLFDGEPGFDRRKIRDYLPSTHKNDDVKRVEQEALCRPEFDGMHAGWLKAPGISL
eukprot:TRINITY_DN1343_c0_g1_i1.p1 TRINITY_DN1343_c0_g1~~TRINITY_DN1343_c0_g1_i1.p1  ORF type:complete len:152 (+),score=2.24 TRINITY_DN1343_c0_g1_i1:113-568(+)